MVTIKYSQEDDRQYSSGERVCTSIGNVVTIIFEDIDFPDLYGDVPALHFDILNGAKGGFVDLRSGFQIGDGDSLLGINNGYAASLTTPSIEVTKGLIQPDGYATYLSGSGTNGK
jgi:hypothetical protein